MDYFSINRVRNAKKWGLSCEDEALWARWKFITGQCVCTSQSLSTDVNMLECPCIQNGWPVKSEVSMSNLFPEGQVYELVVMLRSRVILQFHYILFYFPPRVTGGRLYIITENKPEGICVNSALLLMLILWCLEWLFFQNICKVLWSIYEYLQKVSCSLQLCWC